MTTHNLNLVNLNEPRSFTCGALKYYKQNAASCLGTIAVAAPLIIGGIFISGETYHRAWNSTNMSDFNIYNTLSDYSIASVVAVSFNVITSIACNIIKNSKTYYNRIKQNNYNFLPTHNNEVLKQPHRYLTFIQAIKNTLKSTSISVITGIAAQAFNDLSGYNVLPSIPIAAISSVIANVILIRKTKKE